MTIDDYDEVVALWRANPGVGLSAADSREGVSRYLDDDHCVGFVACDGGSDGDAGGDADRDADREADGCAAAAAIVGAVLCGHDGRRGYVTHLAVAESHRRKGVGGALSDRCIEWLCDQRIDKCHVVVFADNDQAMDYYRATGWIERTELVLFSRFTAERK
jgi:ribosomal protein S18 acetylase RimI-like enzyme